MPKARIFFVEDDDIVAKIREWRLNNLGYSVCGSAKNGVDAITLIKEKNRISSHWISN
jgi:response regulator of citrate/malate metabolism